MEGGDNMCQSQICYSFYIIVYVFKRISVKCVGKFSCYIIIFNQVYSLIFLILPIMVITWLCPTHWSHISIATDSIQPVYFSFHRHVTLLLSSHSSYLTMWYIGTSQSLPRTLFPQSGRVKPLQTFMSKGQDNWCPL